MRNIATRAAVSDQQQEDEVEAEKNKNGPDKRWPSLPAIALNSGGASGEEELQEVGEIKITSLFYKCF